ncbi:MAG: hypothetical protein HGA45_44005, partial [Chloroflexales bacterium]|nr:hypothetical protein [Chloroflexales bacterium]
MKRILALLLLLPLLTALPAAPGRAQSGPPRASDADLAEPSTVCQQVLADPSVSVTQATTPWREYRRARLISTDEKLSSPQSISMVANRDGDPTSGPDIDAVGQEITVTASLAELVGTFSYFYAPGSVASNDELRVELYEVGKINSSGLITTAAVLTGTDRVEGSWQSLYWEVLDATSIGRLRTLGRAALVFSSTSAASPGAQRLWLDDLTASTCELGGSLGGKVTRGGAGLPNAAVRLARTAAGS